MYLLKSPRSKGKLMRSFTALPLLLAAGLGLPGCADFMADDGLQQDVAQLRQDVGVLKANAQRGRGDAEMLGQIDRRSKEQVAESARLQEQAAENARKVDALSSRLDAMNGELKKLSTNLADLSQRVDGLRRQTQSAPTPPPATSTPLSAITPPATSTPPSAIPPPAVSPSPLVAAPAEPRPSTGGATSSDSPRPDSVRPGPIVPAPANPASAEESYQAANRDFAKGHYELAIPAFRDFVRRYPESPLADSAQYNIGESYFSLAKSGASAGQPDKSRTDMEQAVQEFRKVIVNYPRGGKVAPALYKEALALAELKQVALAQSRLRYLIDHFPQSEEAPLAKERLASLK